ncbi:MAG: hypothetical protein QOF51_1105, partial [Chloroflexota bacterium]|nr:hypothetical protein [Chloroflexota bacterium]
TALVLALGDRALPGGPATSCGFPW